MVQLRLPRGDGTLVSRQLQGSESYPPPSDPPASRVAYAAVHVVADPLADVSPDQPAVLDWESTLAYRRHIWRYGLGVAEAMDTAQRGMGLDWETARELIRRTGQEAAACGGRVVAGASTDQLPDEPVSLEQVRLAWEKQCQVVEEAGCQVVLMASRHLAAATSGPDDYHNIYTAVLSQISQPVIIHWLGHMFDPRLTGYWGASETETAIDIFLSLVAANASKIDGVKVSLLDRDHELEIRRRLPAGVRLYTGDDFHYPELIRGDAEGHSDALLGILDAIAPAASVALSALDSGDEKTFTKILAPTVPLSRHIFSAPTYYYKTGITFLAYLNGHQDHFRMVRGLESARSVVHLGQLAVLADEAGLIEDPERATRRLSHVLALAGVE